MEMFSWIATKSAENSKMQKILRTSPLIKSLSEIGKKYSKSNLHFFQFLILNNSGIVNDLKPFEFLFEDFSKINKKEKKLLKKSEEIKTVLRDLERIMNFDIFKNYTDIQIIKENFDNLPNALQKISLLDYDFTENLMKICEYRESILLIESQIFQKEFSLHLARENFKSIIQKMYGLVDEESKDTEEESKTLNFLLKISESSKETEKTNEKLQLNQFWKLMEDAKKSYQANLNSMVAESEVILTMKEIDFIMQGVEKVKEVTIAMETKMVKHRVLAKALGNYFIVKNMANMSDYLELFFEIFEFNFNKELNDLRVITTKAKDVDGNFFEALNLALKQEKKITEFCKSESTIFKFIQKNITEWKGKLFESKSIDFLRGSNNYVRQFSN